MATSPPILLIDIGGTQSSVALAQSDGSIEAKLAAERPEGKDAHWIMESVFERIETARQSHPALIRQVGKCGIGFGGPVCRGRPLRSEHVAHWEHIDPCHELEQRYGWKCRIENDGLCGALGEFHFGAARSTRNMVYLTVSTGIGGGVVLDGRLFRGSRGFAGHLGHLKIGLDGPPCPCGGRGCFEALCSGTSIARRAAERAKQKRWEAAPLIARAGCLEAISAKALFDCARAGDRLSLGLVHEVAEDFGRGLASIYHAFDPDVIVLGGGVPQAGDIFFQAISRATEDRVLPQFRGQVKLVPAGLGSESVLFGALALSLELD
jgi:glucokinase